MNWMLAIVLVAASFLAAFGQILLRQGAAGRKELFEFANLTLASGLFLFAVGTCLWIYALSKAPLYVVYPFTMLTFILVSIASAFILEEKMQPLTIVGGVIICLGLGLIYWEALNK
jgi:drug/metabolite transporter (DMT)-like permease